MVAQEFKCTIVSLGQNKEQELGVLILCSACLSMFPHLAVEFLQTGIALLSGMLGVVLGCVCHCCCHLLLPRAPARALWCQGRDPPPQPRINDKNESVSA